MNTYSEADINGMSLGDNIKTLYGETDDLLPADPVIPADLEIRMNRIQAREALIRRFGKVPVPKTLDTAYRGSNAVGGPPPLWNPPNYGYMPYIEIELRDRNPARRAMDYIRDRLDLYLN